jgi:nicotinamidase-related amidase
VATIGLRHGAIGDRCAHLCVDMQSMFLPGSPWGTPWMEHVLPAIEELVARHSERTVFTRFIPMPSPEEAPGTWKRYWNKWRPLTLSHLEPAAIDIVPSLARFVPPARIVDKQVYSPWMQGRLDRLLAPTGTDTLVVSGGETDVCVLATVMGAVDRGYRVIVASDGVCGSADETHDAAMTLYASRFGEQIELAPVEEILDGWR